MTDEPTTTISTPDRFELATRELGLEPASATTLRQAFESMFSQTDEWAAKAKLIKVTREDQKRDMKMARESRLALREIRVSAEHTRKRLKADIVAQGKAIDGLANVVKALIEPIEAYLLEQETFAARAAEQRRTTLREARCQALRDLGTDLAAYADLGALDDVTWASVLDQARDANAARLEAEAQELAVRVEAERIAAERRETDRAAKAKAEAERVERERLAEEQARLSAEQARVAEEQARQAREQAVRAATKLAEHETAAKVERQAAEQAAREHTAARVAAEREAAEARKQAAAAAAELAARDRADRERAEAEQRRQDEEQAAQVAAAQAPDREKLLAFAGEVRALVVPAMTTPKGQAAATAVAGQIAKMAAWIAKQGGTL